MMVLRKLMVAAVGALTLVGAGTASVGAREGGTLIEFDSMTPVGQPPPPTVRGIPGGGAAWQIASGSGEVDRQGHVSVTVSGLVLVNTGTNPVGPFKAVISCLTPGGAITNVATNPVPAPGGNANINDQVALPHPCKDPIVLVGGTPGGGPFKWFAMSNVEEDDD